MVCFINFIVMKQFYWDNIDRFERKMNLLYIETKKKSFLCMHMHILESKMCSGKEN